jgi:hypothetical protein
MIVVLALAVLPTARAQTFSVAYGSYGSLHTFFSPDFGAFPHFGAFVAGEVDLERFNIGARLSGTSFLFLMWTVGLDAYVGYTLESGLNIYIGAGARLWAIWFPASLSFSDLHGLIGVRFPNDFFLELAPGVTFQPRCVSSNPAQSCSSLQWTALPSVGINFGVRLRP